MKLNALNKPKKPSPRIIAKIDARDDILGSDPAYVVVLFPSGKQWKYDFPDTGTMHVMLDRFGRNAGRFVAKVKEAIHAGARGFREIEIKTGARGSSGLVSSAPASNVGADSSAQ